MKEIVNGMTNEMKLEFDSRSANEAFARVTVASVMTQLNPTLEEVSDVKTAVSEAVTNAIIHGYENHVNKVQIYAGIEGRTLHLEISDRGVGIPDVKKAMEPLYTTRPELERSGMGFSFMEAVMDEVQLLTFQPCQVGVYSPFLQIAEQCGMGKFSHLQLLETRFGWLLAKRERYGTNVRYSLRYLVEQVRHIVGCV